MSLLLLLGVTDGPLVERIAVVQEHQSDKLAWRIDPPAGAASRWAADEALAEKVIDEVRFVGEMPGGYKEASGTLARNPRTSWPDLTAYSDVSIYQAGVEEVWAGRLDKAPESDGDHMAIEPAAIGHQAALEDDKGVIGPGFIDCDLSKWGEPSTQRRLNLQAGGFDPTKTATEQGSQLKGTTGPSILVGYSAYGSAYEIGEVWYYGGGVPIGSVRFNFIVPAAGGEPGFRSNRVVLTSNDLDGGGNDPGAQYGVTATPGASTLATTATRTHAFFQCYFTGAYIGQSAGDTFGISYPKVIGNHGLAPQGTWPEIGFTASQMLGYAIPKYTYLEVDADELEDDGYVIPQAWFSEPGDMGTVVKELTKFGLLDWFVFGGKRFQLRKPGVYGRRWQAYAGPSELNEVGLDAARLWRSIVVRYQDVDGTTKTVGPPGSLSTAETPKLEVTDPDHPAVRADIVRKDILDLSAISTAGAATAAGERWLEEANQLSRSGSCTLTGYVMDDRGTMRPAAQVKPGDLVRFPDAADRSYRKITRVDYTHAQRQASCSLDGPPEGLAALLERYQATLTPLGL